MHGEGDADGAELVAVSLVLPPQAASPSSIMATRVRFIVSPGKRRVILAAPSVSAGSASWLEPREGLLRLRVTKSSQSALRFRAWESLAPRLTVVAIEAVGLEGGSPWSRS